MSETKQLTMKMAKPSAKDYEAFDELQSILVALVTYRTTPESLTSESPETIYDDSKVRAELGERVEAWWDKHGGSWDRVVFGGQMAIENACDPNASTLEFKPAITEGLRILATLNAAEKKADSERQNRTTS